MTSVTQAISSGAPWILQFAGQSSPWRRELDELTRDSKISETLAGLDDKAEALLAAVMPDLTVIGAGRLDLLGRFGATTGTGEAFASVPGILLAQYGASLDVADTLSSEPARVIGHSQGVLAAAMLSSNDPAGVLALARLIGAAATKVTRESDAERLVEATSMLSVRGVPRDLLEKLADQFDVDVAIINSHSAVVISGRPADLELLVEELDVKPMLPLLSAPPRRPVALR